jgi:hypothetical protein
MKRILYLSLAVICLIVTGCGINSSNYPNSNANTNVVIQDGQFRYLRKVQGECEQLYVFGIGGLSKNSIVNNAIQDMYDKANLKDGQVIINITTTVGTQIYFPLICSKKRAYAYGTVIEFTGNNRAGRNGRADRTDRAERGNDNSKSYEQWERNRRSQAERVSAEPKRAGRDNGRAEETDYDDEDSESESDDDADAAVASTAAAAAAKPAAISYPATDKYTFTVADGRKVVFAPGNLRYNTNEKMWMFASNQYSALGTKNSLTGVIDLFCWGTGDRPTTFTKFATDFSDFDEWGRNNIVNGGNNQWRTLTSNEWNYLLNKRDEAKSRFTLATVNGVAGMLILPDNFKLPMKNRFISGKGGTKVSDNKYTANQWKQMEDKGCVFLPFTGFSDNGKINKAESIGNYWSASSGTAFSFGKDYIYPRSTTPTNRGCAVRLVRDAR